MKKYVQIYSVFLLIAFLASCKGQDQPDQPKERIIPIAIDLPDSIATIVDFNAITTPNAPTRITRKVKQDKEGNLLIAAYEDIIRYDSSSGGFTNFTKEVGLDNYHAFDVLEDKKGNIWIASNQAGAYLYDLASGRFTHFTTEDGLAHNSNMCIYEDRVSNIWIGGSGGVSCYDGKSFRNFSTKEGLTDDDVSCIMEDKTGRIWMGTRGTACIYDPFASLRPDGKEFTEVTNDEGKPFVNVWSIIEDRKGNIWIGGGDGLWRYNGSSFTNFSTDFVICVYEDKKGNIWTSNPQGVLIRYDSTSLLNEKATPIQIFKNDGPFLGISEDKEGNIWFGGGDGVWRYDGKTVNYFTGK